MRILLVEDEPDLLANLAQALREAQFAVDTTTNGDDALFKANSWEYDTIILDIMLPGIDGWEVLARLRQNQKTPVLLLTARDSIEDRVQGLDSGADDYLTKPFDLNELLARVRALIRRSSGEAHPIIELGLIRIDTAAKTVTKEGHNIPLTSREYTLLEYLALHRGEVISRTALYEHLFDETDTSLSNLLDVHVSNVRKKLGASVITTRRGQGYSITV